MQYTDDETPKGMVKTPRDEKIVNPGAYYDPAPTPDFEVQPAGTLARLHYAETANAAYERALRLVVIEIEENNVMTRGGQAYHAVRSALKVWA